VPLDTLPLENKVLPVGLKKKPFKLIKPLDKVKFEIFLEEFKKTKFGAEKIETLSDELGIPFGVQFKALSQSLSIDPFHEKFT
jgi:hypothetical protein